MIESDDSATKIDNRQRRKHIPFNQDHFTAATAPAVDFRPCHLCPCKVSHHHLQQDLQSLLALNLPSGKDKSEFPGIDSDIAGRPVTIKAAAFARVV